MLPLLPATGARSRAVAPRVKTRDRSREEAQNLKILGLLIAIFFHRPRTQSEPRTLVCRSCIRSMCAAYIDHFVHVHA
ncbi:Protein of unknown function [Gryllus bimaculatus]|nr:Protein of unknown function [Gryllus bimaculatus]